jgi:pilus assembly protein CpaF
MSLRTRIEEADSNSVQLMPQQDGLMSNKSYQELRARIHSKLLDRMDLSVRKESRSII